MRMFENVPIIVALDRPDLRVVRCGGARKTNALGTEGSAPTIAAHLACRTKGLDVDLFLPLENLK